MTISLTRTKAILLGMFVVLAVAVPTAAAFGVTDWGLQQQRELNREADDLFGGVERPLAATATPVVGAQGAASVKLARGLEVGDVLRGNIAEPDITDQLGQHADMIAYWPSDTNPEWGIVCIEGRPTNPPTTDPFFGVQRIRLKSPNKGKVETILTGTDACDGIRRTPWNTVFATEETNDGWGIEIYDPLNTTNVVFNRSTGTSSGGTGSSNVFARLATGKYAWEGMYIRDSGVMYSGDELAPTSDLDGGAIFKYVPANPAPEPITPAAIAQLSNVANAAASPFAAGQLFVLQVCGGSLPGCTNFGQGMQLGEGRWVGPVANPAQVRAGAMALKGTGYYRPEDLEGDPIALAQGRFRFCWTNTGVSTRRYWGEVLCGEDKPSSQLTGSTPEVQLFSPGNSKMNQPDNIEFQPKTGIVYVIEDTPTVDGTPFPGDIWACLRDGADDDTLTDGCVRILSVVTQGAEPTGFKFDSSGTRAYVNIQHSPDNPATSVNEFRYDEMLEIKGWEIGRGGDDDD